MKITIYELLGMVKDGKAPKRIKFENFIYIWRDTQKDYFCERINYSLEDIIGEYLFNNLNLEVEILENTNEITAEQMMMATDTLNRLRPTAIEAAKNWDKIAEAIKNNFNIPEEEKKILGKLEDISEINNVGCKVEINIGENKVLFDTDTPVVTEYCILKINQLIKNQKK